MSAPKFDLTAFANGLLASTAKAQVNACGFPCACPSWAAHEASVAAEEAAEPSRCECGCATRGEHDAAVEEERLQFLRDPGPPPAGMSAESVARARVAIEAARRKAGL